MVQYYRTPDSGDPSSVHQHFPPIDITLLCCRFWWLRDWHHACLSFPYWRLYWNANPGAFVSLHGHTYGLDPGHIVLLPPNTPFSTDLDLPPISGPASSDHLLGGPARGGLEELGSPASDGAIYHFFVHFTAGLPYDEIAPAVFRFPADSSTSATFRVTT